MAAFFARFFLFIGFLSLLYLGMLLYLRYKPNSLAFQGAVPTTIVLDSTFHGYPSYISIPGVGISLPVYPAVISDARWETTDKGVSYLTTSPLPGEKGNAVLYGHNWQSLLGNMRKSHIGDTITITYQDGYSVNFSVAYITTVSPAQVKILDNSSDSRLTIYTCTGFLDSKRFVITALKASE